MTTTMARRAAARRVMRRRECETHVGNRLLLLRAIVVVPCTTLAPCYEERSGCLFFCFQRGVRRAY